MLDGPLASAFGAPFSSLRFLGEYALIVDGSMGIEELHRGV